MTWSRTQCWCCKGAELLDAHPGWWHVLGERTSAVVCFVCGGRGWSDLVGDEVVLAVARKVASGMRDQSTMRAVYAQHRGVGRSILAMRPDFPDEFEFMISPGHRVTYRLTAQTPSLVYTPDRSGWSPLRSDRVHQVAKQLAGDLGNGFMLCETGDPYRLR